MTRSRSKRLPSKRSLVALGLLVVEACAPPRKSEHQNSSGANARPHAAPTAEAHATKESPNIPSYVIGNFAVEQMSALQARELAIRLKPPDASVRGELLHRDAIVRREGGLLLVDRGKLSLPGSETKPEALQSCSFVIDCDDERVSRLARASASDDERKPSSLELQRFVRAHIGRKNLAHGLVPASVTAELGEGDCSEHAMLLTAMARLHGYAARPVFGIVLIALPPNRLFAWGHAWTEVYDDGRWQVRDAALVSEPVKAPSERPPNTVSAACPIYIPIDSLPDEGPAFGDHGNDLLINVSSVGVSPDALTDLPQCWLTM